MGGIGGDSVLFWFSDECWIVFCNIVKINLMCMVFVGGFFFFFVDVKCNWLLLFYIYEEESYIVSDYFGMLESMSVIVVKDGKVLFEEYIGGNDVLSCWIFFLVIKLVMLLFIGVVIVDGYIYSVLDLVVIYLFYFEGIGYEGVIVEDVLYMVLGVVWNEDYVDFEFDVVYVGGVNGFVL